MNPAVLFRTPRRRAVERLLDSGYRYATALVSGDDDAQDLVHDAWLKLRPRYGSLPDKALFFRTIRHRFIDTLRHRQHLTLLEFDERDPQGQGMPRMADDVEELPDRQLAAGLAALRDTEREALFLNVVEGYTADEIAAFTGRSRGTVLSVLHRARHKLRRILEEAETDTRGSGTRMHDEPENRVHELTPASRARPARRKHS